MREITFREAINEALHEEMGKNERVFVMGQDVGVAGGMRGVTAGLYEKFGAERAIDTPISEESIAGAGVGAAVIGMRPVVEIMYADFLPICMDEIYNKAGKWRYAHGGGDIKVPVVFRVATGGGFGGGCEHSQSLEAIFMHAPGLIIVYPSTPEDAKGLLKKAINDDNPVLYFEHRLLYGLRGPVPDQEYFTDFKKAAVRKEGSDISLVGFGHMLNIALEAAAQLEEEGISIEVIDLRTLKPFDREIIGKSVEKTGCLITVEEGVMTHGVGAEIAAFVAEEHLFSLRAPVKRVGALDSPIPYSPPMEKFVLPNKEKIVSAAREIAASL